MATTRFDTIAKFFARRKAADRSSQAATPAAWDGEKIPYLFVQSFAGGSITPKSGTDGTYTVTLDHGLGQTVYFGDRPSRDVGVAPTAQFLQSLGFPDDNPPNAALVVDDGNGGTEIAVVELRNPDYDAATNTATYDVAGLADWKDSTELGLTQEPADLADLPENLGPAHLFIDDCPNGDIQCFATDNELQAVGGYFNQPFCYNYLLCIPCEPYGNTQPDRCSTPSHWIDKCSGDYGQQCGAGGCNAQWPSRPFLGC
jgi:hypothetical protein